MIHITKGSGKMSGIDSINVSSLKNPFCIKMSKNPKTVCSKCYSNRYSKLRPTLEECLIRNTILLTEFDLKFEDIPILNYLYFRFNSFGELYNERHLRNLIAICNRNINTTFTLWTKRKDIVGKIEYNDLPGNLILIYSQPEINKIDYMLEFPFDKTFNVVDKNYIGDKNCHSKCMECLKCYKHNEIRVIIEKIK